MLTEAQIIALAEAIREIVINDGTWQEKKKAIKDFIRGSDYEIECAEFMSWFEGK